MRILSVSSVLPPRHCCCWYEMCNIVGRRERGINELIWRRLFPDGMERKTDAQVTGFLKSQIVFLFMWGLTWLWLYILFIYLFILFHLWNIRNQGLSQSCWEAIECLQSNAAVTMLPLFADCSLTFDSWNSADIMAVSIRLWFILEREIIAQTYR